ncbi:copper amine oxidase [Paenibacillus sp. GCM10027626]|uniref:copper amine oxidase n=1 Tax=Paenibacillus sp. GCM10027626 TaxID=3273411 RepID=UPI003642F7B9
MKKRIILASVILSLCGGSLLYAMTEDVKIWFNNQPLSATGIISDGKVYVPINELSTEQKSIVQWDPKQKKLTIDKPNVHLTAFGPKPFGQVSKGHKDPFSVFAQIDSLKTDLSEIKITITNPKNKEQVLATKKVDEQKEHFWFVTNEQKYLFDETGDYYIRCYMKPTNSKDWFLVSELQIPSTN